MALSLGKGITGQSGTLVVFGQSLPNYLSSHLNSIVGDVPWSLYTQASSYDLSNVGGLNDADATIPAHHGINNEVIVALAKNDYAVYHDLAEAQAQGSTRYGSLTLTIRWYRSRDDHLIWTQQNTWAAPATGIYYPSANLVYANWIGWITPEVGEDVGQGSDTEIQENGDYYCVATWSGAYSKTETSYFTVTGIPSTNMAVDSQTPSSIGVHAWYQGTIPVYTCKIFCDGVLTSHQSYYGGTTTWTTGVGTKTGLAASSSHDFYTIFYDQAGYEVMQTEHFTYATAGAPNPLFDWSYAGCEADGTLVPGTRKSSEYHLYVSAAEWNELIDTVTAKYTYKGIPSYTPTMDEAVSGNNMLATQFNQVKNAIGWFYNNSDPSSGIGIANKTADSSNIVYSDFNTLRTKLNGIT